MNNRYTFNKYSVFNNIDTSLNIEKKGNQYLFEPKVSFKCGNIQKPIIRNTKNNVNTPLTNIKTIQEDYQKKFCKYPIMPLESNEGLQQWENKQPIKYDNNGFVNFSTDQFPIDQLNSYRILNSYDNTNLYSHTFFMQLDGKLVNRY